MLRSLLLRMSRSRTLASFVSTRRFGRRAVRRFMPGERLEDAIAAARTLARRGFGVVLTELGENVASPAAADDTGAHYLDCLDRVAGAGLDGQISVKATHLGLDLGESAAARRLERLVHRAEQLDAMVWVDMEDSSYVDRTLALVEAARRLSPSVGVCLQAYLHRTPDDLDRLRDTATRVRLVKGAYREDADVAIARRRDVDRRYHELAVRMFQDRDYIAAAPPVFGTHDHRLIDRVRVAARDHGIAPDRVEFHMLYGIRTDLQERLLATGAAVRVLISYGDHWYPWYMRRLAERPANLWFVAKQLLPR